MLEFNWQYGLAFVVAISYAMLWNVLHIQFLRKYYFKTHESFMRFLSKYFVLLLIFHKDDGTWNQDDDASDPGGGLAAAVP